MNNILWIVIIVFFVGCQVQKTNNHLNKRKVKALHKLSLNNTRDTIIINQPFTSEPVSTSEKKNYVTISTFYATDRNITMKGGSPLFGTERSASGIHYGLCNVSIPKTHEIGHIESPFIRGIKLLEIPDKHVSIVNINSESKKEFFIKLGQSLDKGEKKSAYIFIHGYNVSFGEAARNTAQLYYDFGLKGSPIFYSWPSKESYFEYSIDEENNEWSTTHFKEFLNDFLSNTQSDKIYLIAHSMGNRLLVNTLITLLKERKNDKARIKEIILVAPDIDSDIFKNIVPSIISEGRPITLYTSSGDVALKASKIFNGYQRVGDSTKKPFVTTGIETIDASNINTDILGHSYLNTSRPILDDISYLINNNLRANQRRLQKKLTKNGVYWEFIK